MTTSPANPCLGNASSTETLRRCGLVLDWLIHVERPFASEGLEEAEALVLTMVRNAIEALR
jgi:hypothetical protein